MEYTTKQYRVALIKYPSGEFHNDVAEDKKEEEEIENTYDGFICWLGPAIMYRIPIVTAENALEITSLIMRGECLC